MPHTTVAPEDAPASAGPDHGEPGSRLIDIGRALDLLDAAVNERGAAFVGPAPSDEPRTDQSPGLAAHALSLDGVPAPALDELSAAGLREMFARRRPPVPLTLGALIVLEAAQRSEDRGRPWGDSVEQARRVALRFLALLPTRAFA